MFLLVKSRSQEIAVFIPHRYSHMCYKVTSI